MFLPRFVVLCDYASLLPRSIRTTGNELAITQPVDYYAVITVLRKSACETVLKIDFSIPVDLPLVWL